MIEQTDGPVYWWNTSWHYRDIRCEKAEVVKESSRCLWLVHNPYHANGRVLKQGRYHAWFDNQREALVHAMKMAGLEIVSAQRRVEKASAQMHQLEDQLNAL